jgi:hypothetical protein
MDKIETVKKILKAHKVEEMINGYYVRFRKSKSNKAMLDDIFEFEDVMEEDGWKRIGTYEIKLSEKAFERIYDDYMEKLFSRSA